MSMTLRHAVQPSALREQLPQQERGAVMHVGDENPDAQHTPLYNAKDSQHSADAMWRMQTREPTHKNYETNAMW